MIDPTWVPNTHFLGGRPAFSLEVGGEFNYFSADVTQHSSGPQANRLDYTWGVTDLYPEINLAWSSGVHHWMVYLTGDVPVGTYSSTQLANVGLGHAAIDSGGGYTFFNSRTGFEFLSVAGVTFNFTNPNTDYQNGIDSHADLDFAYFLNERFMVGVVGYVYVQLSPDSGSGAKLGSFESGVASLGPEIGYFFKVGGQQLYANFRFYYEYWAQNRVQGGDFFGTVSIPIGSPPN